MEPLPEARADGEGAAEIVAAGGREAAADIALQFWTFEVGSYKLVAAGRSSHFL